MKDTKQAIRDAANQAGDHVKEESEKDYRSLADKAFKGTISIKSLAGISDAKEEAIYAHAFMLYNTGRYKEAAEIFRLLVTVNATEPKYMMGLAACFHLMKAYESAISSYQMCTFLDPSNPVPHFHLSDCYIQIKDPTSTVAALKAAIRCSEGRPEFNVLRERCEITLSGMSQNKASE